MKPPFAPMLSSPVEADLADQLLDELQENSTWVFEQKVDGDRKLVHVIDGETLTVNRDGDKTTLPAHMASALTVGRPNFAVDGELVGRGRDRRLWLFDLLWVDGMITLSSPWHERRSALATIAEGLSLDHHAVHVLPFAETSAQKRWLRAALRASGGEGLVLKQVDHTYLSGRRNPLTLKVKWRHTVDCVVTGAGIDGHDNIGLSIYDGDQLVEVGEVTAQAGDGRRVVQLYNAHRNDPTLPRVVVEVTCQYATDDNRLFQPTLPKLRVDKRPEACTVDQLDVIRSGKAILPLPEVTGHRRTANGPTCA